MPDTTEPNVRNVLLRRLIPVGLFGAALGIAAVIYLGNAGAGLTSTCPAQTSAAAAIDKAAGGELAALQPTAAGRGYSDLAFVDENGTRKTLADLAGKPLLVNFWATWCVPCRKEMPELDQVAAHYDSAKLAVVPINLDLGPEGVTKARAFLKDEGLTNLTLYADPSYDAFERLKSNAVALGLPATILLDSKGCEIAVLQGPAAWNSPDGYKVLDALIAIDAKNTT